MGVHAVGRNGGDLQDVAVGQVAALLPGPDGVGVAARHDQIAGELDGALSHLREVHAAYWDNDWRREHRGLGRYPEHELWEAVDGYLELRDAAAQSPADSEG